MRAAVPICVHSTASSRADSCGVNALTYRERPGFNQNEWFDRRNPEIKQKKLNYYIDALRTRRA
jgi:hypothetical protein